MTDVTDPPGTESAFCRSCGAPRHTDDTYCTKCAAKLDSTPSRSGSRGPLRAILGVAIAFVVLAATIAVLALGDDGATAAVSSIPTSTAPVATTSLPAPSTTTVSQLNEKELVEEFGGAVLKVTTDGCNILGTGTGFAIDRTHIVTNRHVVENDTTPTIVARDGSVYEGSVVGWREDPDIAVIRIDGNLDTTLQWADSDELGEGERTVSLGYPLPDHDFSVAPGVILSFDDDRGHRAAIRSDAQLDRGNSGGPMLLADGSVAGVVTRMDLNMSGFQFVPIIIPSNDVAEKVDWIVDNPSRPTVDCDEVVAPYGDVSPVTTTTFAPSPPPIVAPETFYTVILASLQQRNASFDQAMARARTLDDQSGVAMHVLDSNRYSSLTPGYWVVYAGTYTQANAKYDAERFRNAGFSDAYAQKVSR